MMNPKAWETVNGFTANVKAASERLGKLASYFPESAAHIAEVSARLDAEGSGIMKALLTEAITGIEGQKQSPDTVDRKGPATLVVEGVTGKRISKVSLEEAGADLPDMAYVVVEFDDDTELQFNVGVRSQLIFAVSHNARSDDEEGEMEPVKRLDEATIRSLVEQQTRSFNKPLEPL